DPAAVYQSVVTAFAAVADAGGDVTSVALSPKGQTARMLATDADGRPLSVPGGPAEPGRVANVLGVDTVTSRAVYDQASATVGVAGDWTAAVFGTVAGVQVAVNTEGSITDTGGTPLNLWQRNMFAVRAEIEVGFRVL